MTVENILIAEPVAQKTWSAGRTIVIELTDGKSIIFPADRFKLLSKTQNLLWITDRYGEADQCC